MSYNSDEVEMVPERLVGVARAIVEFHVPGIYVSALGRPVPTRTPRMDSPPSSTPSTPLTFALFGLFLLARPPLWQCVRQMHLGLSHISSSFWIRTSTFHKGSVKEALHCRDD